MEEKDYVDHGGDELDYTGQEVVPNVLVLNDVPLEVDLLLDYGNVEQLEVLSVGYDSKEVVRLLSELMDFGQVDEEELDIGHLLLLALLGLRVEQSFVDVFHFGPDVSDHDLGRSVLPFQSDLLSRDVLNQLSLLTETVEVVDQVAESFLNQLMQDRSEELRVVVDWLPNQVL